MTTGDTAVEVRLTQTRDGREWVATSPQYPGAFGIGVSWEAAVRALREMGHARPA